MNKQSQLLPRRSVRVIFSDGDSITTDINGTEQDIKNYYAIGREFNIGYGPHDKMVTVTKLEFV